MKEKGNEEEKNRGNGGEREGGYKNGEGNMRNVKRKKRK